MSKSSETPGDSGDLFAPAQGGPPAASPELRTSPLDEHFASLILRLNGAPDSTLAFAARAVSSWRNAGHTCLPLASLGRGFGDLEATLLKSRVVGRPGEWKPLILDTAGRLYLQRYWAYEQDVAEMIRARADSSAMQSVALTELPLEGAAPEQRLAVETALRSAICVITGGPGTGKTRTVAYLVSAIHRLHAGNRPARIALAAPTGKAAARITESLRNAVASAEAFNAESFREIETTTVHRLLGAAGDLSTSRYNATNPIRADYVIVDEASMIDLAMMWRLLLALSPDTTLVLLGDKDQLASVEAGNVFSDLCAGVIGSADSALAAKIVTLKHSFRTQAESGIQRISSLIREGKATDATAVLLDDAPADIELIIPAPATPLHRLLGKHFAEGYGGVIGADSPGAALEAFAQFRVLSATRGGLSGVDHLNSIIERALLPPRALARRGQHYVGQPIMVLENDYGLGLFNGDIGIVWRDEASGTLRAFFQTAEGPLRGIAVSRLPRHETAWAMTVHKSQGSEFERVLLVLPDAETPMLTRELIYTAFTRTRSHITVCGQPGIAAAGIRRTTERFSGLRDALWRQG